MVIRTFFWHARVLPGWLVNSIKTVRPNQSRYFRTGNAGDIFARQLIRERYGCEVKNTPEGGQRLLCVGSIGHMVQAGDVLAGIGVKSKELPSVPSPGPHILGLRGPISHDIFKRSGYDVSSVRFQFDPGLLIGELMEPLQREPRDRAIFVPHYRERWRFEGKLSKGIEMVDIDSSPASVAREILDSSLVYASSLHGIIFAHALKRPCVFVRPQSDEPLLKYEDYFLSVGLPFSKPAGDIERAIREPKPTSPADINVRAEEFRFPSLEDLSEWGVAVSR